MNASAVSAGDVVWRPAVEQSERSGLVSYRRWLERDRGLRFDDYAGLWSWSVDRVDDFWESLWEYEEILADGTPTPVLAEDRMPGARWFPNVRLNYAEHCLRRARPDQPALVAIGEGGDARIMTWAELSRQAGALAAHLRAAGVRPGDCVAGYVGIGFEAVVALLATTSLGAVWTACAPEFGVLGVVSRFGQLRPSVLITTSGYRFGGKLHLRGEEAAQLIAQLPTLQHVVWTGHAEAAVPDIDFPSTRWTDATCGQAPLEFNRVAFDHPLWVLFSSGTTGTPKGIVHGHGGIVLEHLKTLRLHNDVRAGDRFLFVGSTSWMVFNLLVSGLLIGATVVLLEGSPAWPDLGALWRLAAENDVQILGAGAGYVHACLKEALSPASQYDLSALREVCVTGSPLSPAGYAWLRDEVDEHVWPNSTSGGTDVCSGFVGGCPLIPVRAGRLQAPALGVAAEAWDECGRSVVGEVGELVIRRPMPSMPIGLLNDPDGERMRASYFSMWPGVWRHGDFISFDDDLSSVITGRSDSTLNRNGVRIGPAELYAVVEALDSVREALVVGVEQGDDYYMPLFVSLIEGADPSAVRREIVAAIRASMSPRHIPDEVVVMPSVPHTRTGKKLEVPIKRLLQGEPLSAVVDRGSVDDPAVLDAYARFADERLRTSPGASDTPTSDRS